MLEEALAFAGRGAPCEVHRRRETQREGLTFKCYSMLFRGLRLLVCFIDELLFEREENKSVLYVYCLFVLMCLFV